MNNIKKLRSKKGMTQTEFCAKCGLARTYISFLENGNKKISLDAAHRMSSVLECSIFELLGDNQISQLIPYDENNAMIPH